MLVLTRKPGEMIRIGEDIEVRVLYIDGRIVGLGIDAPREVEILREEVYLRNLREEIWNSGSEH